MTTFTKNPAPTIPPQSLESFFSYDGRFALYEAYFPIFERFMPQVPDEVDGVRFIQAIGISIASKVGVEETVENGEAIASAFIFFYAEMAAIQKFRKSTRRIRKHTVSMRPNRFPNA
jgi:hypothetical protein